MARRQLDTKGKGAFIAFLIERHPLATDGEIAKLATVDRKTVVDVRKEMQRRVEKLGEDYDALNPTQRREFVSKKLADLRAHGARNFPGQK
jgi:hypothetical protein